MTATALPVRVGQDVRSRSGRFAGQVIEIDGSLLRVRGFGKESVVDMSDVFAEVGDTLVLDCEPEWLRPAPPSGTPLAAAFAVTTAGGRRMFRVLLVGSAAVLGAAILVASLSLRPRTAPHDSSDS